MFELLMQPFALHAFIAGTLIAIVCAVVGYFVVLRSQSFAAHSLSHVGFAGATAAGVLGISALFGMFGFTLLSALGIGAMEKREASKDVEIGMFLSFSLGLGVLFLHIYTNSANEAVSVLFGSLFSVTVSDLITTVVTSITILILLAISFRPLLFSSIDPEVAQARGISVRLLSTLFLLILALAVAQAIQVVGALLVFSLLIAPAAAAQHLSLRPWRAILIAITLGVGLTWVGLLIAVATPIPVSFSISALSGLVYFLVTGVRHRIAPHQKAIPKHHTREVHWR